MRNFFRRPWLMIETEDPSESSQRLITNGIPCGQVSIERPHEAQGVSFPSKHRDEALNLLGFEDENLRELGTEQEDIVLITPYSVTLESEAHMERWPLMSPVLYEYAREHRLHIFASNPHGKASNPENEQGTLHVRFWSAPEATGRKVYGSMFGIDPDYAQADGLLASGKGKLLTDLFGEVVAEVVDTTLYVLFDLPDGSSAGLLLRAILNEYTLFKLPAAERNEARSQRLAEMIEQSKERYVEACKDRFGIYLQSSQKELAEIRERQSELSRSMVRVTREERSAIEKIELLREINSEAEVRFAQEFDLLLEIPKVVEAYIVESTVVVKTSVLTTSRMRDGTTRELGAYVISIPMDGGRPKIRNLTRVLEGYTHHPYDTGNGEPCYGNISEGMSVLMGAFEFSAVAQLMIEFLESSPIDLDLNSHNWPIVKENSNDE